MRVLERFFLSPEAAVFLPASFFSGALEAVAGALEAGFLSAALGGMLAVLGGLWVVRKSGVVVGMDCEILEAVLGIVGGRGCGDVDGSWKMAGMGWGEGIVVLL